MTLLMRRVSSVRIGPPACGRPATDGLPRSSATRTARRPPRGCSARTPPRSRPVPPAGSARRSARCSPACASRSRPARRTPAGPRAPRRAPRTRRGPTPGGRGRRPADAAGAAPRRGRAGSGRGRTAPDPPQRVVRRRERRIGLVRGAAARPRPRAATAAGQGKPVRSAAVSSQSTISSTRAVCPARDSASTRSLGVRHHRRCADSLLGGVPMGQLELGDGGVDVVLAEQAEPEHGGDVGVHARHVELGADPAQLDEPFPATRAFAAAGIDEGDAGQCVPGRSALSELAAPAHRLEPVGVRGRPVPGPSVQLAADRQAVREYQRGAVLAGGPDRAVQQRAGTVRLLGPGAGVPAQRDRLQVCDRIGERQRVRTSVEHAVPSATLPGRDPGKRHGGRDGDRRAASSGSASQARSASLFASSIRPPMNAGTIASAHSWAASNGLLRRCVRARRRTVRVRRGRRRAR